MQTSPLDEIATPQSNYEKYRDLYSDGSDKTISMDSFYKLLVAEMSNQDPLEPTSNTEFISQLASFSSLQAQQDNFDLQKQNYANSLVGKTVSVELDDGKGTLKDGVVQSVTFDAKKGIMANIDGTSYKLDEIKRVLGSSSEGTETADAAGSALSSYGAFAAGILGKTVIVQGTDANGDKLLDSGVASSLEIQDGKVRVVVNGYAYDVTEVVSVSDTAAVQEPEETEQAQEPEQNANQSAAAQTPAVEDDAKDEITGASAERTDDEDIADLTDPEESAPQETQTVENSGTWLSPEEQMGTWMAQQETQALLSLFGE